MMLSSGNCLRLSVVILLTPQEELFRAPRMECKPARHPCSICQPVGSQSCIRHMTYLSHVRDNGMPKLVNAWPHESGNSQSYVQTNHKMPPFARSVLVAL